MPIQVTCPGCHTRFKVSEKFAGQQGACPKCKHGIQVPSKEDEVVVHTPVHSEKGAVDSKGRSVLKPIARTDARFQPLMFAGIAVAIVATFLVAYFAGQKLDWAGMTVGAILLGPPIAWGGYTFLRDQELEAYTGRALLIRSLICGLVYAVLWGVFVFVCAQLWGDTVAEGLDTTQVLIVAAILLPMGSLAAYASFDLEWGNAFFHYALYLVVTILLRITMGLPAV